MSEMKSVTPEVVNDARTLSLVSAEGAVVGTVRQRPFRGLEKVRAGFRAGGIFWILAVCCLPIPLLHFILVPLNIILGTMLAWNFWTAAAVLENGQVVCPNCRKALVVEKSAAKWPLKVLCSGCAHQLRLYEAGAV